MSTLVFYAGMLYAEYAGDHIPYHDLIDLPQGAYIHVAHHGPGYHQGWYRSDLTPVAEDEVPKELKALVLLLT